MSEDNDHKYNIFDVAKDVLTGNAEYADKQLQEERERICQQCEIRNELLNMCTACGCFIHLKVKFVKSECPVGKW